MNAPTQPDMLVIPDDSSIAQRLICRVNSIAIKAACDAVDFAEEACGTRYSVDLKTIARGGIVGSVEIVDCVSESDSPWFVGAFGFVLRDPRPIPFIPFKGRLGFFDVPGVEP